MYVHYFRYADKGWYDNYAETDLCVYIDIIFDRALKHVHIFTFRCLC